MACARSDIRRNSCSFGLFPRPCSWRETVCSERTCLDGDHGDAYASYPGSHGHLLEIAHGKGHTCTITALHSDDAWYDGESDASDELGTDALRRNYRAWVLPRRSFGSMFSTFHHGECLHRLWHCAYHTAFGGTGLVTTLRAESRILR